MTRLFIIVIIICSLATVSANAKNRSNDEVADIDARADFNQTEVVGEVQQYLMNSLAQLQIELERWSIDHSPDGVEGEAFEDSTCYYPDSMTLLIIEGYITDGIYNNPLRSVNTSEAIEVPFGWSEIAPGNFSYLKHYDDSAHVIGYILLLYGHASGDGWDITGDGVPDGVIWALRGGPDHYVPACELQWFCGVNQITFPEELDPGN